MKVDSTNAQYCFLDIDCNNHRQKLATAAAFVDATDSRYGFSSKNLLHLGGSELSRINESILTDHGMYVLLCTHCRRAHRQLADAMWETCCGHRCGRTRLFCCRSILKCDFISLSINYFSPPIFNSLRLLSLSLSLHLDQHALTILHHRMGIKE